MRLATWNVNSLKIRLPRVEEWLDEVRPDVLCLQETKLSDATFPTMAFQARGYDVACHGGEGRWNGVAIASRVGLDEVSAGFPSSVTGSAPVDDYVKGVLDEARLVAATCAGIRVVSVYVPNGRSLDDPHYTAKLEWLRRLRELVAAIRSSCEQVVVAGDFNIAPDDRDVYDPAKFVDATHVSPEERALLAAICDCGLSDLFRRFHADERLYSWWDYRAGDFHQGRGLRIDLVLGSDAVADRARWALIDRNARKGKSPSDHAPVVVELDD